MQKIFVICLLVVAFLAANVVAANAQTYPPPNQGCTNYLTGSSGPDNLIGTTGDDCISGLAGNDTISGGAGNDILYGGSGSDYLYGGYGNDYISPQCGVDHPFGEWDADTIVNSDDSPANTVSCSFHDDHSSCGMGYDTIYDEAGIDDYGVIPGDCEVYFWQ